MVEFGIVKFFDERDGKKFGFLRVLNEKEEETGEEVFFHYNDGMHGYSDGFCICYRPGWHTVRLAFPSGGEKIAFERTRGKGGRPKACPWSYAGEWDEQEGDMIADDDDWPDDGYEDEEDIVSTGVVYGRALRAFNGNHEMAREATEMYPGDFI